MKTKKYKVRRPITNFAYGAEVSVPPEWANKYIGELVTAFYDGIVVLVPEDIEIDIELLKRAVKQS